MRVRTQIRTGPFVLEGCGWLVLAAIIAGALCLIGALGTALVEYP